MSFSELAGGGNAWGVFALSGADLFIISSGDKVTDFQLDKPKTN